MVAKESKRVRGEINGLVKRTVNFIEHMLHAIHAVRN